MKTVTEIKQIWNYLTKETELKTIDVDSCLHILNSDFTELKKIYNYIVNNFGIEFLKKAPGVLSRSSLDDIIDIENAFKKTGHFEDLSAGILRHANPLEVEKVIKLCETNDVKITTSVFRKSAKEIEKIIEVCRANDIEITGSVFMKSAEEIEKIIEVCRANDIEITGSVFHKSARQIAQSIEICQYYGLDITNKTLIFKNTPKQLQAKINYLNSIGEPLVSGDRINAVFGMSNKNLQARYGISVQEIVKNYYEIVAEGVSKGADEDVRRI